jgi:hypothetical protein
MRDWKYACAAAVALLGIAAFILFVVHPGGFEGQIAYFFALLPGVYMVLLFFHPSHPGWANAMPHGVFVYWLFVIGGSFIWYFILSFVAIKGYRLAARFRRRAGT